MLCVAAWPLGWNSQPKVRDEYQLHSSLRSRLLRAMRCLQGSGLRCSPAKPSKSLPGVGSSSGGAGFISEMPRVGSSQSDLCYSE